MTAQPERKWNLVKAGILAAFGLALAGIAVAVPSPTQRPAGADSADPLGKVAAARAQDEDARDVPRGAHGSRDPSLAGLSVSPDAPDTAPIETF
jgi:hypothetical protein